MTLREQIAADTEQILFSVDDCAEEAQYVSPTGDVTEIIADTGDGEELVDLPTDTGILQVRRFVFSVQRSQLDTPQVNGKIIYDGETWPVVGIGGSDQAVIDIVCELPAQSDRSRRNYRIR